jgi:amino acid adenylation domain-containing protein
MIVGLLGVLHAGAAYVPVDPEYPAERVSAMVASAGVAVLLTQRELIVRLPRNLCRGVLIEDALNMTPRGELAPVDPESLAYIIFTSGSTGRPNGVCVSHRSLVNLLTSMRSEPGLTANDTLLAVTNLCFDISALELLLPLINGAQLVVASAEEVVDGSKLLENIRRNSITIMQATPSTWRLLVAAGWSHASCKLRVLCGGEALSPDLANKLMELSDSVWNLYGPTETTIWSGLSRLRKDHPITIGRPICNTRFFVLDSRMQRVPVGIPGELYIGGDGLARGYIDRPDLSNERFVANPFDSACGIVYKTGDEVRYCADGEIEYLRRLDTQVKLRGFRIELGEVESVVARNFGVQQAVAIVREDTPGDTRLVCYVVPERDAALSASALRAAIRKSLPEYMIPMLVYVESIPLTANGKIDRTRLPAPIDQTPGGVGLPRNAVEKKLLLIWRKVLRLKGIGIQDNFFDLGGHSLVVIELLAEIKRVFGKQLPVSTVFKAQTIEEMAAVLSQHSLNPFSSLVAIQSQGLRPALFVIPGSGGTVFEFAELARLLGSDQPVYGLQSIGLDGEAKPLERIEEIAKNFVGEIRRLQPGGPYHLAGFCLGGVVAFEMAQQLIASGEEVPVLALVETWFPSSIPALRGAPAPLRPFIFLIRGLLRHLGAMLGLPPGQAIHYFRLKSAIIREMVRHRDIYRGEWSASYKNLVIEANYRAGSRYVPAPLPGRLLLFLAANRNRESDEELLAWSRLARQSCPVFRISGEDVNDLIRYPYVQELAVNLKEQLDESIARAAEQAALATLTNRQDQEGGLRTSLV